MLAATIKMREFSFLGLESLGGNVLRIFLYLTRWILCCESPWKIFIKFFKISLRHGQGNGLNENERRNIVPFLQNIALREVKWATIKENMSLALGNGRFVCYLISMWLWYKRKIFVYQKKRRIIVNNRN